MGLAQVEGVAALAALAHKFDFELACPVDEIIKLNYFTTRANKMPVTIKMCSTNF